MQADPPLRIFIGITGKRKLGTEQQKAVKPVLIRAIKNIVESESRKQLIEVVGISPLAEGADMLFANTMLEMGYRIKSYLPFEEEEYLKDFTSPELKEEFKKLYASIPGNDRSETGSLKIDDRNDLYQRVGERVVDESDYIVAIWNEIPGKPGGTADIVKYLLDYNEDEMWKPKEARNKLKNLVSINISPERPLATSFFPRQAIQDLDTSLPIFLSSKKTHHDLLSSQDEETEVVFLSGDGQLCYSCNYGCPIIRNTINAKSQLVKRQFFRNKKDPCPN